MKRIIVAAGLVTALTGLAVSVVSANTAEKPEKMVIVGTAVDLTTYAMEGSTDAEHTDAFKNRCELGFPVGIVDEENGEVYVAVFRTPAPAAPLETANEILQPLMGKKIAAQGMVYRAEGVNLIRLAVVSEY